MNASIRVLLVLFLTCSTVFLLVAGSVHFERAIGKFDCKIINGEFSFELFDYFPRNLYPKLRPMQENVRPVLPRTKVCRFLLQQQRETHS